MNKKSKIEVSVGDYIVRIAVQKPSKAKIGLIHKVNYISWSTTNIQYGYYVELKPEEWRYATVQEIKEYHKGNKNIYNIVVNIDNFSII